MTESGDGSLADVVKLICNGEGGLLFGTLNDFDKNAVSTPGGNHTVMVNKQLFLVYELVCNVMRRYLMCNS